MPKFVKNILGFVHEAEWLDVGFEVTRQNDPIDTLLGDDKTDNLMAEWESIASEYQIPMAAHFHGFDTESNTTFRVPIDSHNIEKGLIKVKLNQSERMRALVRTGVKEDKLYDYVINDGVRLSEQVFTRSKVAKNELLATGKVTIKENNLNLTVDYGVSAEQTSYEIDFAEDKDVFEQIEEIVSDASDKGAILNGIYTSKAMLSKMRKHPSVQKAIHGASGVGAIVKRSELESHLSEEYGINYVITNDLTYGKTVSFDSEGKPIIQTDRYYPADKITFFATNPGGRLGVGLWGNPPEIDAKLVNQKVNASGESPYVYVSQWMENDPAVLWTKASGLFMPVLYNPSSLYIATAKTSAANTTPANTTPAEPEEEPAG